MPVVGVGYTLKKKREEKGEHTMISRRVSRLTLKGIFLITIAVGMISSSGFGAGVLAEAKGVVEVALR
jgi:hypothetical protein